MGNYFSVDLEERLQASKTRSSESDLWIAGCRGAANAYVVLLGSSPGAAAEGEKTFELSTMRPRWDHARTIGPHAGIGSTPFGPADSRRNRGWRRLFLAAFGGETPTAHSALDSLTAIWNLDWRHEKMEKDTRYARLVHGARDIIEQASLSRPRVIVTLTAQVSDVLSCAISSEGLPVETKVLPCSGAVPYTVRFRGVEFPTLIVRSIRHPSYNTLNQPRLKKVAECCGKFLRDQS